MALVKSEALAPAERGRRVTAVLGPTNTGKTHLAIERMLGHSSGIIGLPLRLLAREVYQKMVDRVGEAAVALITGEEKIKPAGARYWVSTVEAMPRDLDVAFVAVDEIQLAADLDRGHVFTDRILNRRGREETMLLGASTMKEAVETLLPGAAILGRPRLSSLTYAGEKKLARLPRRSAIVAFSAEEVYAVAEWIRRQRGGAAVVLGALSPRTRNAQVQLYQSGEVDYLVATDAIGMGLNLDVDHVAFAGDRKFDGYQFRRLNPVETAQIAGRAGRALRDGTFGTTGRCDPFEPDLVRILESHTFPQVKVLQWRNPDLDFTSIERLVETLSLPPSEPFLTRAPDADDVRVLTMVAREPAIRARARGMAGVARLWDVCQVPDYRKVSPMAHAEIVSTLYGFVAGGGKIDADWFARQVDLTDNPVGDIDALSARIAQIRTWTFAANRSDWLADPEHWQSVTRAVEDKLSDALHARIAERFVDRRTSVLMRRLRENSMSEAEITKTGDVVVEGHTIGHLAGFQFVADASAAGSEAKALRAAAQVALTGEITNRANRLASGGDDSFALAQDGTLRFVGEPVGKLVESDKLYEPRIRLIADELLAGAERDSVQARLDLWIKAHVQKHLGPLLALEASAEVQGIARGVAFQLVEALGVLDRQKVAEEVKGLEQAARATLRNLGVRFGAYHIYMPGLMKPAPRALAAQLWALKDGGLDQPGLDDLRHLAASGRTSVPVDAKFAKPLYRLFGYRIAGERAVRVDILERLADLIRPALAWRPNSPGVKPAGALDGRGFTVTVAMTSLVGSAGEDFSTVLKSLGYRLERRPAPPPEAPAPVVVEPVAAETAAASDDFALADFAANLSLIDIVDSSLGYDTTPAEPEPETPPAEPVAPAEPEAAGPDAAPAETAEAPASPAEPEMIEVWRPGGRFEGRRDRPNRDQPRGPRRDRPAGAPGAEARPEGERPRHGGRRRPEGEKPEGGRTEGERPRHGRPDRRSDQAEGGHRGPKRFDRPRDDRRPDRDAHRDNRPDRGGKPRVERQPDPNSPFAALAKLKAELEAKGKS